MRVGFPSLIVLFVVSQLALAQSTTQPIQSEAQLVSALCDSRQDAESREFLLKSNSHLVNEVLWRGLIDRAAAAYYNQSPENSLAIYDIAIKVAAQLSIPQLIAATYYNLGRTYSGLSEFRRSIDAYENSKRFFAEAGLQRDLLYVLADLGALHYIVEDYQKAIDLSEESLTLAETLKSKATPAGAWPDEYGRARALHTLAEIDLRRGNHLEAIDKLKSGLALYQQLNGAGSSYNTYIAGVYSALGRVYPEMGDYRQALFYLNKALALEKASLDRGSMASLLNSIGYLYMEQEDYAQAKAQFNQSLHVYRALKNQREEARVLMNLGVIAQREANYEEALAHLRLGLQTARATQSIDVTIAASEGIGVVLTAKKDFAGALEVLNESLAIANEIKDKTRQTEILWRTAQTYYETGDYTQSAALAETAVSLARAMRLPKLAYLAATALGRSYAAQNRVELAINTLTQAVEQMESMRHQVAGNEVGAQLFLENKVDSYHTLVELFIKQGKALDALLFAERAKGRVLLDVLSGGKADLAKFLTNSEKEEIQRLNQKISEISDRIKAEQTADSSALNNIYRQLDAARLDYRFFQDALYVAHPNLKLRSGQTAPLTEADVNQLTLNPDVAYLEYVTSKERVYLFVLTKSASARPELKVYPIPIKPGDLARKVNQFHQRLANRHPDFAGLARELYAILIEPARQQLVGISTIGIVPDGFLWNLPFQALMTGSNRYFIEDHALFFAPSLSVLREISKDTRYEKAESSLIAFGNPVIGRDEERNEELCPLPEAETEVTSIAKTQGSNASKVLIGREATEKTFRELARNFRTIHLATHGVLDNRDPLYSYLMLTKTEGDPENDGLLEAREIMNMNLNADLAVLSACETANGRVAPGEGVIGMSWAFFVAGTRSMLVTQWKVNSASTSQLMMNFYEELRSKEERSAGKKAQALQKAALKLMKNERYHHPFYWAGFVMIGDGISK